MDTSTFPTLTTERLTLRQLSIEDQEGVFALRSDPEINKYIERNPSKTIEDAINFINLINDNSKKGNTLYWAVTLTSTKTFVGAVCLLNISEEKSSCEIGYELITKFQGQGIMKEAVEKVIDYVFQKVKLKNLNAIVHYKNQSSLKLLAKFNFIRSPETYKENPDFNIFTLTY
ncbi:GNAT family N-acetyltransferase [Ferruginibacter albus]|uniref:GNAT family N-acetyltransferase n=1 Tax=Ferruginibacter albus TaxID=2875540 RepID=UPI001CC70E8D|nr:GNAT family N-acetyltransferase [Ferruginibacter albus]UAY51035.1 GNAT family N-acetyltransferase [Ferruginibacter albus]